MRANEFIAESKEYILYINGKPAAKYTNEYDANRDLELLAKKYPHDHLELKFEVCDLKTVRAINEISDERLQDYLSRAGRKVDSRMTRMAQEIGRAHV